MPCCGRPRQKKNSQSDYYAKYGYLNKNQIEEQLKIDGTKCPHCDALTITDAEGNCTVCKQKKDSNQT